VLRYQCTMQRCQAASGKNSAALSASPRHRDDQPDASQSAPGKVGKEQEVRVLHGVGNSQPPRPRDRGTLRYDDYVLPIGWGCTCSHDLECGCWSAGRGLSRRRVLSNSLRDDIAIQPGAAFRGLVATFDGAQGKPSVDWSGLHGYDALLWRATGNDHRMVGLWWSRIPTLFQYSPLMTPAYYLLLTDFLSRPGDKQVRSTLVLTHPNERMLRLWGVRYMITDFDPVFGMLLNEMDVSEKQRLRLIELSGTNLGGYSPTEVHRAADFREGLRVMHEPTFDGRRTVVVDEEISGQLVPAAGANLTYQKTSLSVQASSTGRSLVVLPVQYSRCWTVRPRRSEIGPG
jgi:hypothetical protein